MMQGAAHLAVVERVKDTLASRHPKALAARVGDDVTVSFEFFPPKTEAMAETLWSSIERLAPLDPLFVSVTYGAGGSTRERTHDTVVRILKETSLKPAAHLTCVAATRAEVDAVADQYWEAGVRHIVALRGDMPEPGTPYAPHPGGYAYAADLVAGLKARHDFEVSVAAYPEVHPDAPSAAFDLDNLKRKLDAGASRAITQFFFDTDRFERFLEQLAKTNITVPVVPGILPVGNFKQATKFAAMCGASIPDWMTTLFEGLDDDPETRKLVAATLAVEQVLALVQLGVRHVHLYTLNRADLAYAICHILGQRPKAKDLQP